MGQLKGYVKMEVGQTGQPAADQKLSECSLNATSSYFFYNVLHCF